MFYRESRSKKVYVFHVLSHSLASKSDSLPAAASHPIAEAASQAGQQTSKPAAAQQASHPASQLSRERYLVIIHLKIGKIKKTMTFQNEVVLRMARSLHLLDTLCRLDMAGLGCR